MNSIRLSLNPFINLNVQVETEIVHAPSSSSSSVPFILCQHAENKYLSENLLDEHTFNEIRLY